jgi:hypothetical protein
MNRSAFFLLVLIASPAALAEGEGVDVMKVEDVPSTASVGETLLSSDRIFAISTQADTMAPMSFRVGTVDQLETIQAMGTGYYADVFADFALTSWLQVGATMNYGTIGDPAVQNVMAPTAYAKAQFLRQATAGVNMAASVNLKKIGFGRPTDAHPNDGEMEASILLDKRIGNVALALNGVFGKSFSVPDSDAELKASVGYHVYRNLLLGVDTITRYDTSFDGGPKDGTRYWEFTGGGIATLKVSNFLISGLAGVSAPMHNPAASGAGVGPMAMVQLGYTL